MSRPRPLPVRRSITRHLLAATLCTGVSFGTIALAAGHVSEPPPADLLAGPKVSDLAPKRLTIVVTDLNGRLQPLDEEPEVAALRKLPLSDAHRAIANDAIDERVRDFDALVEANYAVITRLGQMRQQRDVPRAERREATQAAQRALRPWLERGTAIDELKGELPAAILADARALADEYYLAMMQQRRDRARERENAPTLDFDGEDSMQGDDAMQSDPMRAMDDDPMKPMDVDSMMNAAGVDRSALERFKRTARFETLRGQVRRSIESNAAARQGEFEDLQKRLELTPEQAERAKQVFAAVAAARAAGRELTPEERRSGLREFLAMLDPEQRRLVMRELGIGPRDGTRDRDRRGQDDSND